MPVTQRVPVSDGVELGSEEHGQGDRTLVLVHGYTGSRDDFREHLPALARHGRTLAVDLRGHGEASNPGRASAYSLEQLRDDLAAALPALDASPCDLLGHSMGGMVALRYALAHPERVQSLVLMDTTASAPPLPDPMRKAMEAVRQLAREQGMAPVIELMRKSMEAGNTGFSPPAPHTDDAYPNDFGRVLPKLEQLDPEAFATLGERLFGSESLEERLPEIRCATTVIVGEADLPFLASSKRLAERIPGARLEVIPQSAHQPQLENPARWREVLEAHLARVRSG